MKNDYGVEKSSELRVFFLYNDDNYNGKTIDMEIIANFFSIRVLKMELTFVQAEGGDMMLLSKGDVKKFSI